MDHDEALTLLGVDADADARTLKRAYLRRLKKTKPERDPEGFQRLREAYELLDGSLESPRVASRPERAPFPVVRELETLPTNEAPAPAPAELPSAARPSFAELVGDIYAALDAEDFEALWPLVARALDRAETEGVPCLPAVLMIEATLTGFLVMDDPEPGRRAFVRWSRLAGVFDAAQAEIDVDDRARLTLVAELVELPSRFPPQFAKLIASALLEGDPDAKRDRITDLADELPSAAIFAQELLMRHAPGLSEIYSVSLGAGKLELSPTQGSEDHPLVRVIYLAFLVGLVFLLNVVYCGCTPAP